MTFYRPVTICDLKLRDQGAGHWEDPEVLCLGIILNINIYVAKWLWGTGMTGHNSRRLVSVGPTRARYI